MRLIPIENFDIIFKPLIGLKVGVVDGPGNVGDILLQLSTRQLLDTYQISHQTVNPLAETISIGKFDKLLLFGGGNMGYSPAVAIRRAAVNSGIPCIVLPQSVILFEEQQFEEIYLREQTSLSLSPRGKLAPDLALGFDFPDNLPLPHIEHGLFLRRYGHAKFSGIAADPAEICNTPEEYWNLARLYKSITTDRLHFAICAIAMGCNVTLLPVDYHKNKSMWEHCLKSLGCGWSDNL